MNTDKPLGLARAEEDFEEIGGFTPEESKALAQELLGALGQMAEVEKPRLHLEILQWRELGDDEDSLSMRIAETDAPCFGRIIAEEHDLNYREDAEGDEEGLFLSTNEMTFTDGEVITCEYSGRKFRINITEVA